MTREFLADLCKPSPLGSIPISEEIPIQAWVVGEDYVALELLGAGSMGEVWRARQVSTRRDVAIKVLRPGCPDPRFTKEIEALGRLDHPGITRLHQAGTHADGRRYFVMELVDGEALGEILKAGPMEPRTAASVTRDVARALAYLAGERLVHRDIKPSNVLVEHSGRARVTDFGLVKDLTAGAGLTLPEDQLGTPAYMAPEQVDGSRGAISARTDIYGAGAMLYHALTGQPPFAGRQAAQVIHQVAAEEPDWQGGWGGTHRDLKAICMKAMAKDPQRRYGSAGELADDLDRFLRGEPIRARLPSLWERTWRKVSKPAVRYLGGMAVLLAVAVAIFGKRSFRSEISALLREWPAPAPNLLKVLPLMAGPGGLVAFSPDGKMFTAGGNSNVARTATISPWKQIINGYPRANEYSGMLWSPDSREMLLADIKGTAWLWNVQPDRILLWKTSLNSGITAMSFNGNGTNWAVGARNGAIQGWRREGVETKQYFKGQHAAAISLVKFLPGSDKILAVSEDSLARVWDPGPDRFIPLTHKTNLLRGVDLDGRGELLALATMATNSYAATSIEVIRVADGKQVSSRRHNGRVHRVRFSPDGSRLAVASSRAWIEVQSIWGELIATSLAHGGECVEASFSPDGLRVISVDTAGFARIWDAHTGDPLSAPWKGREGIGSIALSPDGLLVASGDLAHAGSLWDASCPLPHAWDKGALVSALKADNRIEGLRRAAWLSPGDAEVLRLLAAATERAATNDWQRSDARFLKMLAGGRRN